MKVQILHQLQERLETVSLTTKNLSLDIAKLRSLKYGIESQSQMFEQEIDATKTQIKINIDDIIFELADIKEQVK